MPLAVAGVMHRLALALLAVAACVDSHHEFGDGGAIQMNDVTILFPLTGAPSAYPSASDHGAHGVLLPEALYDAVGHIGGTSGPLTPGSGGDAAYADLHVVAVRLDPCFAALVPDPHGDGCANQLRVVFQEVRTVDGQSTTFDSGLHAFYSLSRADLVSLAKRIGSLRAENSTGERLGGLAPHPIMVAQGMDGEMARGLRELVLDYAGAANRTRGTKLSASEPGFAWSFSGFDVSDASAATFTPMIIPTVGDGVTDQSFFRGFANDFVQGQFSPPTTSADDLVPLADEQGAANLTPEARQAAFDGLTRVDHPGKNSPDTIDCASCHLATPVSQMIAAPMFSLIEHDDAFAFHADGTWVLPTEMAPTFDATGNTGFNIHALSYVDRTPAINQRVVNETAAIVAYLNAN